MVGGGGSLHFDSTPEEAVGVVSVHQPRPGFDRPLATTSARVARREPDGQELQMASMSHPVYEFHVDVELAAAVKLIE